MKYLRDALSAAVGLCLAACVAVYLPVQLNMADTAVAHISASEAHTLTQAAYTYLDVRTPQEFANGHAPKAINIPFWLKDSAGVMQPNPQFMEDLHGKI